MACQSRLGASVVSKRRGAHIPSDRVRSCALYRLYYNLSLKYAMTHARSSTSFVCEKSPQAQTAKGLSKIDCEHGWAFRGGGVAAEARSNLHYRTMRVA